MTNLQAIAKMFVTVMLCLNRTCEKFQCDKAIAVETIDS